MRPEPSAGNRRAHRSDVRFAVRLTPRGGLDRIEGVNEAGALQVRVSAPPIGGAANASLIRVLAEELGVARSDVHLIAGAAGRQKLVAVDGVSAESILDRWPDLKLQGRREAAGPFERGGGDRLPRDADRPV